MAGANESGRYHKEEIDSLRYCLDPNYNGHIGSDVSKVLVAKKQAEKAEAQEPALKNYPK